jgi:hypothetical protein
MSDCQILELVSLGMTRDHPFLTPFSPQHPLRYCGLRVVPSHSGNLCALDFTNLAAATGALRDLPTRHAESTPCGSMAPRSSASLRPPKRHERAIASCDMRGDSAVDDSPEMPQYRTLLRTHFWPRQPKATNDFQRPVKLFKWAFANGSTQTWNTLIVSAKS